MDITKLVRDPTKVHEALKRVGQALVAIKPIKIYFPESYLGSELGSNADNIIKVVAIFGIVVEDKYYGVSSACALFQTEPTSTNITIVNNERYMEFSYGIGSKLFTNVNLVRTSTIVYRIYVEFISKGNVPWYFSESDLAFLFSTALLHGNANLNANSSLLELLSTVISRLRLDKTQFYRFVTNAKEKPVYIPLNSVILQAQGALSKTLGAYFSDGLTSALANPDTETTELDLLENVLRK